MTKPVYFVGAGPGDPDLITIKGRRLLEKADRVIYTGSLVPQNHLACCKQEASTHNSASLTLAQTHALIVEGYRQGELVVRLHTGDPSLYGAIQEQMALLERERIPYQVVPGVSAVFAAAAALKQELTLPEVSQTLILTRVAGRTQVPEHEQLRKLASHRATLVIYLSVQQIEQVVTELLCHYPVETPMVVAYRVGWPEETLLRTTLAEAASVVKAAGISRQALIMVGDVFAAMAGRELAQSKLYDESFKHGYRKD